MLLCAGAIFTPAILQRSGIGPRGVLEAVQVPCVRDLPVGQYLQDHPVINGCVTLREPAAAPGERHANALARFTSGGEFNNLYFVSVDASNDPRLAAEPAAGQSPDGAPSPPVAPPLGFVDVMLMKCRSRGRVEITSGTDPLAPPHVELGMLQDPVDREHMRVGARKLARLLMSPHFDAIAAPGTPRLLGRRGDGTPRTPEEVLALDDDSLDVWMRANASDGIHISCSVPMGEVLDARGHIPGVAGLRVCDASVMPTVPRANTHASTIAVAEAMAEFLIHGDDYIGPGAGVVPAGTGRL